MGVRPVPRIQDQGLLISVVKDQACLCLLFSLLAPMKHKETER